MIYRRYDSVGRIDTDNGDAEEILPNSEVEAVIHKKMILSTTLKKQTAYHLLVFKRWYLEIQARLRGYSYLFTGCQILIHTIVTKLCISAWFRYWPNGRSDCFLSKCLFQKLNEEEITYVTIYVDDILIYTNNEKSKLFIKKSISTTFKMKDVDKAHYILGMRLTWDRYNGKLWLDQELYIRNTLQKFNMNNCNTVSTPEIVKTDVLM